MPSDEHPRKDLRLMQGLEWDISLAKLALFGACCLPHFLASAEDLDPLSIRITPTPTVLFRLLQFWAGLHYMSTINHCVSRKRLHTHTITLRKLLALQNQLPLRNACA